MALTLENLTTQLMEHLECPVCLETCTSLIYMCENGHIVCNTCQERIQMCCICRASGKPMARCNPLEQIATLIKLPCEYAYFGCPLVDTESPLPECVHGIECFVCKDWLGSVDNLKAHMAQSHASRHFVLPPSGAKVVQCPDLNRVPARDLTYLLEFNGACFWYESKHSAAKLTSTMRLLGHNERKASQYYFVVDYECKNSALSVSLRNKVLTLTALADEGATNMSLPKNIVELSAVLEVTIRITIGQKSQLVSTL